MWIQIGIVRDKPIYAEAIYFAYNQKSLLHFSFHIIIWPFYIDSSTCDFYLDLESILQQNPPQLK